MGKILGNSNLEEVFLAIKESGEINRFCKNVVQIDQDNLERLRGKQFVIFSNHLSHADYFLHGYNLMNQGFSCPVFTAGKNLDVWPINWAFPFDKWGKVIWIDRQKIKSGTREDKRKILRYLDEQVSEVLERGENLVDFVEGGRSYTQEFLGVRPGIVSRVAEASREISRPIYGIPVAVSYDRRIEEQAMPAIKLFKDKKIFRPGYYVADISSFLVEYYLRKDHPTATVKFGQPFVIQDYAIQGIKGTSQLIAHLDREIRKIYSEIKS
jgi:1-acyl-sn-glycerol-3-phosphate acyltransferase